MSTRQRKPNGISKQVGLRIRAQRLAKAMTQKQLGENLDPPVTFQQVQRYEHGTDRLSTDHLYEIATVLEVSAGSLFPSKAGALTNINGVVSTDELVRLLDRPDTMQMLYALKGVTDGKRRALLVDLVEKSGKRRILKGD